MDFRVGEDVKMYFPVTDQVTGTAIDCTGAAAQWTCGTLAGNTFTPRLTKHTTDITNPITIVENPQTPNDHTTNTFLVLLDHSETGDFLGEYFHELAMELDDFRIVLYPPILQTASANFTVYPSWSWDSDSDEPRIAFLEAPVDISQLPEPEPEPLKPGRKIA